MKELPKSIYIDALALVPKNKSGVGTTLEQTLAKLATLEEAKDYTIYLVAPLGKARFLQSYKTEIVKTKTILLPARLLQALMKFKLLPPMDWFLGRGVYVFPNYRNWPLWRSRSLTYIYDTVFISYPETVQPKNQKYLSRHINMWLGRTDRVITISEQVKLELERLLHVFYGSIDVVPCGVNAKVYKKSSPSEIKRAKEKYKIPYAKYLLFVGNIEPRKNLVALIDAYAALPENIRQEYGLVFAGAEGWLNQAFKWRFEEELRAGLNIFHINGYIDEADLPAIYNGAGLLVHPAIYEGFGMTPLEAMACGTPVAVSDIPVLREVIQNAGQYFDPGDTDSIKQAILTVLNNPKRQESLVEEGFNRVKSFSWSNSAEKLFTVIESQFKVGPRSHPLLSRLKSFYVRVDRLIRRLLGDKVLGPYRPAPAANPSALRRRIYDDFIQELPADWRSSLLATYLATKHFVAENLKSAYGRVRTPK